MNETVQRRGPGSRAGGNHPTRIELLRAAINLAETDGLDTFTIGLSLKQRAMQRARSTFTLMIGLSCSSRCIGPSTVTCLRTSRRLLSPRKTARQGRVRESSRSLTVVANKSGCGQCCSRQDTIQSSQTSRGEEMKRLQRHCHPTFGTRSRRPSKPRHSWLVRLSK